MNYIRHSLSTLAILSCCATVACGQGPDSKANVPPAIKAVLDNPRYKGSTWGLRVVDLENGQVLMNLEPNRKFLVGSVRKLFSVGQLLNQIGPAHTFDTPVYYEGTVSEIGTLHGNLILVASGDLTMGGRTKPDGTMAITNFDHNEANALGNAELTQPDPLAGYAALAQQIAAFGIKKVTGEIIIDDRLFKPYRFRDEFDIKPIFVNDDVVDAAISPTNGPLAALTYRPLSAALSLENAVAMRPAGTKFNIGEPPLPACIGQPGCTITIRGDLPAGLVAPLTGQYPIIRSVRIVDPSSYARTVLIEKLRAAGVEIAAPAVERNPVQLLPRKDQYPPDKRVALLKGLPYSENAKFINKVSYNIGADASFLLWGLTKGADEMKTALAAEKENLRKNFGITPGEYTFLDGSGSGETIATTPAVTRFLAGMYGSSTFASFFASLPLLGIDGSLATVTEFESDASLAPAKGQVRAKTGTFIEDASIRGQAFAGYIQTRGGRKLAYQLVVNNVPFKEIEDVIQVFQDEGRISAILWRDN